MILAFNLELIIVIASLPSTEKLSRYYRVSIKIIFLAGFIITGQVLSDLIADQLDIELTPYNEPTAHRIIMVSMVLYSLLMAIPFVPGAEIGFATLTLFGGKIAPLVYLCTVVSLTISYGLGSALPEHVLVNMTEKLGLSTTSSLIKNMSGMDADSRFESIANSVSGRVTPFLLKYRYIALVLAISLPGNIIIGGGGGVALLAGMSRIFSPIKFVACVGVAVAPVPLAWMAFG